MSGLIRPWLLAAVALGLLSDPRPAAAAEPVAPSVEQAIARVQPALVRIRVVATAHAHGREVKQQASGSGVIITREGHVITNHHVAGRAARIVCVLAHNEELEAILVGTDPLADIAVLKLLAADDREFPFVEFGDSAAIRVGDEVLAMGSPLALSQSVTRGIISNTKMVMPGSYRRSAQFTLDGEPVGAMVRWLAHDAPIFPGNSGGPLVDLAGRVVGINEISFGLGGAIPANLARDVAAQLIAQGRVTRSWLGLELQPLLKRGPTDRGVLVRGVAPGSPAAEAGIAAGDILLSLADRETTVRFDEEIPLINQRLAALPIGAALAARLWRAGKEFSATITPVERQPAEPDTQELSEWGVTARNLSALAARELKLGDTRGALITSVRPAGPAGRARTPLQAGDVITAVNDRPITQLEELVAVTTELLRDEPATVPVVARVTRMPEELLTVVEIGARPPETPAREASKAWLPVAIQVISRELAAPLGDPAMAGVRITQVYAGHSADRAGLQVGDLIVAVDDAPLRGHERSDEEAFLSLLRQYRIGATPRFAVRRGTAALTLEIELERAPLLAREMARCEDERFEFTARDLSFFDRAQQGWAADRPGALVVEVKSGGWAALGELAAGDLIEELDGAPIADVAALEARLEAVAAARPAQIVVRVLRGVHTHFLELETNWKQP